MRVVTWNLQSGINAGRTNRNLMTAGAVLAELDADLIALQEVDRRVPRSGFVDQAASLAQRLRMDVVRAPAMRVQGVGTSGNALLARGQVGSWRTLKLPRAAGATPRSALVARVEVKEQKVTVAVAHLSIERSEAKDQLDVVAAALAAQPGPRLLMGDLNLHHDDAAPILTAHGLTLAVSPPTYPAPSPRFAIDHLAGDGLTIVDVTTFPISASDHQPLIATVGFPG